MAPLLAVLAGLLASPLGLAAAEMTSGDMDSSSLAALDRRQSCTQLSCTLAALSGSSTNPYNYTRIPAFVVNSECCIISYNPAVADNFYSIIPGLRRNCEATPPPSPPSEERTRYLGGECRPKTLVFAAGTGQDVTGGGNLGQDLQEAFDDMAPGDWYVQTVNYTNDNPGVFCMGLPGGWIARETIANTMSECPDTAIFVGGYSQGAMVAHDAVANSTFGSSVSAVLVFGDPFNGADIRGYSGPIRTYCAQGDLVCAGLPSVLPAHLSYTRNIDEAASFLNGVTTVPTTPSATARPSSTATGSATGTGASSAGTATGTSTRTGTRTTTATAAPTGTEAAGGGNAGAGRHAQLAGAGVLGLGVWGLVAVAAA